MKLPVFSEAFSDVDSESKSFDEFVSSELFVSSDVLVSSESVFSSALVVSLVVFSSVELFSSEPEVLSSSFELRSLSKPPIVTEDISKVLPSLSFMDTIFFVISSIISEYVISFMLNFNVSLTNVNFGVSRTVSGTSTVFVIPVKSFKLYTIVCLPGVLKATFSFNVLPFLSLIVAFTEAVESIPAVLKAEIPVV